MGNQLSQRQDLASQFAASCKDYITTLNRLNELAARAPYLGAFQDSDFTNTSLAYLDAGTVNVLFTNVIPSLQANYLDSADGGRNVQILNQVAGQL